jgi:ParB-like chromosome segregation protein Spo0J
MAQAVFSTGTIHRTATMWSDLPENILLPPIELSGRKHYDEADIASLAAEIFARGQDTPAKVRKNDSGKPILVYGRRRYLAVKYINEHLLAPGDEKRELECTYERDMTDEQALIAAIAENFKRKDVNDMDHAANIERLMKFSKKSVEYVAGIYFPEAKSGKEKADALRWVRERAGLIELAPEAAAAVRDGRAEITAAVELSKLPKDVQRKAVAETTSTVAGKARIKVKDVQKYKPAPVPRKPVAKTNRPDPADVPFEVPVKLAPLPSNPVLAAAETMGRALDVWLTDATAPAEKALIAAHKAYRALVPLQQAVGKAA